MEFEFDSPNQIENTHFPDLRPTYVFVLSSTTWESPFSLRRSFTSSWLQEGSCRIYVNCVCLCIVVSSAYLCCVFLLLSSSCVPRVAIVSGFILIAPSVLSNLYFPVVVDNLWLSFVVFCGWFTYSLNMNICIFVKILSTKCMRDFWNKNVRQTVLFFKCNYIDWRRFNLIPY